MDEIKEASKRTLRRILKGGKKRREEEELWRNALDMAVAKQKVNISTVCQTPITPCQPLMKSVPFPRSA
eukprot:6190381-Ditylum_brightwellii.AAC.1